MPDKRPFGRKGDLPPPRYGGGGPFQKRNSGDGSGRSSPQLPKALVELIQKVSDSIREGEAESLRATFDQAQQDGLFFHPPHWQAFLDALRKGGDPNCLEILWNATEASRDHFRLDDLTAQFALAAAWFELPALLAEIVMDTKNRTAEDQFAYQTFWKGCRERFGAAKGTPDEVYVRFAKLGLELDDTQLLEESLSMPGFAGIFLPRNAWNLLATEALSRPELQRTRVLWNATLPSRKFLSQYEFALFAELAVVLADAEIFGSVFDVVEKREMFLPREVWNRMLRVAIQNPDAAIARSIWERGESSREYLTAWDFSHFALLASSLRDPGLLEVFFDGWAPEVDTLLAGEHATWGAFLKAAEELSCNDLILKMICRLEMHFDPIRHHNRGSLQETVIALRSRIEDPHLAREIGLMLRGDHWSIRQFLLALRAYPPREPGQKGGPFEGACRRIMKRLINSFVGRAPESFEVTLRTVVQGIMALGRHREAAFFSVMSRGHENFAGNLQSSLREAYIDNLAFVEGLDDQGIVERIGEIGIALSRFEKAADELAPEAWDTSPVPESARGFIEVIARRQERHLAGTLRNDPESWSEMKEAFDQIDHPAFGVDEWSMALSALIATVLNRLAPMIRQQFKIAAHRVKDDFHRDFVRPLTSGNLGVSERDALASKVRLFLGGTYATLRKRPMGLEIAFNLESAMRKCFRSLREEYCGGVFQSEDGAKWIAGREGIKTSVIEPMLAEVVENCRRAFDALDEDQRFFEVSLKSGTGRDSGFQVLTIVNSRPVESIPFPASSKLGLGAIQVLARSVQQGGRCGDARFDREALHPETGVSVFITTLLFPAWEGENPISDSHAES